MKAAKATALLRLFDEIPALFHCLRDVASEVHGTDAPTQGERAVLRSLDDHGPQTVPQLARARLVSRQHVQVLVNGMLRDGLLEVIDNPAHRKSRVIRLTGEGKRQIRTMQEREAQWFAHRHLDLTVKELEQVLDWLGVVRRFVEAKD